MPSNNNLAIFDLDNTLLSGDSDVLWGEYLVAHNIVDADIYTKKNLAFYEDYKSGCLDIYEFLAFALKPLAENPLEQLLELRAQYIKEIILPLIGNKTRQLLQSHRDQGHILMIITATNHFVTKPIADELGVDFLLATDPEIINGNYTGQVYGTPCFQQGKVERIEAWLKKTGHNLSQSWFYSDSHNDLPLLEKVTHPIAVDPDETLKNHAEIKQWPIMSLSINKTD